MGKKYENDFKVMIVGLLESGRTSKEISDEYGVESGTIRRWRREFINRSGDFDKKRELSPQEKEIKALRKELKDAQLERDILKKAVSIFSKSDN